MGLLQGTVVWATVANRRAGRGKRLSVPHLHGRHQQCSLRGLLHAVLLLCLHLAVCQGEMPAQPAGSLWSSCCNYGWPPICTWGGLTAGPCRGTTACSVSPPRTAPCLAEVGSWGLAVHRGRCSSGGIQCHRPAGSHSQRFWRTKPAKRNQVPSWPCCGSGEGCPRIYTSIPWESVFEGLGVHECWSTLKNHIGL